MNKTLQKYIFRNTSLWSLYHWYLIYFVDCDTKPGERGYTECDCIGEWRYIL